MKKSIVYKAVESIETGEHEFCCNALNDLSDLYDYDVLANDFQNFYGFNDRYLAESMANTIAAEEVELPSRKSWRVLMLLLFAEAGGKL